MKIDNKSKFPIHFNYVTNKIKGKLDGCIYEFRRF